jgi:MOSC domain-containing protein YiiM
MGGGRVLQVNVSEGGVPKRPVALARVTRDGVEGDRHHDVTGHGGPHRAVSILGIEAIRRVADEGNPIAPGTTGENLTTEGFDVSLLPVGTQLAIGGEVVLELSGAANPCRTIRGSFRGERFARLSAATHPADSRMYARVVTEGSIRPGDPIELLAPSDDVAARFLVADRLDRAERASSLAFWRAAVEAGEDISILDEGEIACAAAPDLPGEPFNQALGVAHLPNLVDLALRHFDRHSVTGWVLADEPPWPGAIATDELAQHGGAPAAVVAEPGDGAGADVRELGRDEVGPWAEVIVTAAGMSPRMADVWRRVEVPLAAAAHYHRFVAELDGHPVAAGTLVTHHRVGWFRAGTVMPAARGRGLQRRLLAVRAQRAIELGCDLIGASATAGSVSAANLERCGIPRIGTRRNYRHQPNS